MRPDVRVFRSGLCGGRMHANEVRKCRAIHALVKNKAIPVTLKSVQQHGATNLKIHLVR